MKISIFVIFLVFLIPLLNGFDVAENGAERSLSRQKRSLFYPQYTVLQISMCLVAQVSGIKSHRVAINTGLQMNYNLPYKLSEFISPIWWARSISQVSNPVMDFFERLIQNADEKSANDNDDISDDDELTYETTEIPDTTELPETTTMGKLKRRRKPKVRRDLTAGQFYSGIKESLSFAGYHDDCLLKSVCELAKHPLHYDDDNVMRDLVHFVLTPSLHQAFDITMEQNEMELYEEAEAMGRTNADCEFLYGSQCQESPLATISNFIAPDDS